MEVFARFCKTKRSNHLTLVSPVFLMKLLIAIDDSEYSQSAVDAICDRPWPAETEIQILSVVDLNEDTYQGFDDSNKAVFAPFEASAIEDRERLVNERVALVKKSLPGVSVRGQVKKGDVKRQIAEEVEVFGADILVMGSHGRRGLQKLFLGSIAESMLSLVPCVVEIVKCGGKRVRGGEGDETDECSRTKSKTDTDANMDSGEIGGTLRPRFAD